MVRIILLIAIIVFWIKALLEWDGKTPCDDCPGDLCPFHCDKYEK